MSNIQYLSQEGYDKLDAELKDLKKRGRKEIAEDIAEARAKGDLSENAEYDAAKEAQGHMEDRITKLEDILANARVLDASELDLSQVRVLTKVTILNKKVNKEMQYTLVSPNEADFKAGKISIESPIGSALVGKEIGDVVSVKVPAGELELEIKNRNLNNGLTSMKKLIDVYPYRRKGKNIEFLILKRSSKKIYAHQWRMVGGKVKEGETYWEAGIREFSEELSETPKQFWTVPSVNSFYEHKTDSIHQIPAFAAELKWNDEQIELDDEHSGYLWVKASRIDEYIHWPEQKRLIRLIDDILTNQQILPEWIIDLK